MSKRGQASRAVRKYLQQHPDAKPIDVANTLKRLGVTPNLVSNIKSRTKRESVLAAIATHPTVSVPLEKSSATRLADASPVGFEEQLLAAAELIRRCGDFAAAHAMVDLAAKVAQQVARETAR
ncbi:MAG: hypothetical protein O2931_03770 [Planctomycetota bacterium]|nr:hypothetical protein [Planctomycetota bacterium]MDA1177896.1 hypothetical protein [Planctomycetota bacterium]